MAKGLLVVGKEVQGGGVLAAYMLYFHPQGGGVKKPELGHAHQLRL